MWIIPKKSELSAFVPDTAGSNLDLDELSQICEQSLMWRSKPSLARTWLQRLKRVNWMQHLSGRILKPSMASCFVIEYTLSLAVIPAKANQLLVVEKENKTRGGSGSISGTQLALFDLTCVSSKMSKGTRAQECEQFYATWRNSDIEWNRIVANQRGECLRRLSVVQTILDEEFSYLPTPTVKGNHNYKGCSKSSSDGLVTVLKREYLPTPCTSDTRGCNDYQSTIKKIERGKKAQQGQLSNRLMMLLDGDRGELNPLFVERMMGLPTDHTGLDFVETESSRKQRS